MLLPVVTTQKAPSSSVTVDRQSSRWTSALLLWQRVRQTAARWGSTRLQGSKADA